MAGLLSQRQRQMLYPARTTTTGKKIQLIDEATSNVDERSASNIPSLFLRAPLAPAHDFCLVAPKSHARWRSTLTYMVITEAADQAGHPRAGCRMHRHCRRPRRRC